MVLKAFSTTWQQHLVVEHPFAAIGGIKKAHPTQCRMRFMSNIEFLSEKF